ncbi:hypothetical protein vseg_014414 [Gypsophila vaccaria]
MGANAKSIPQRAPTEKPPFTLSQLKRAIPPHCFKRSLLRSFSYVFFDLIAIYIIYNISNKYIDLLPKPLSYLAWALYAFVQGCIMTGVWVLAHECGHHAFSDYKWLDDSVGLVLHSLLLTPYFSWKLSHKRHHANHNSLEKDEVFVPNTIEHIPWYTKYYQNPIGRVITLSISLALGLHMYFLFNFCGRKYARFTSHYDPKAPIYLDHERTLIYISDVGVIAVGYGLLHLITSKGLPWVMCVYGGPLLVMNAFIVIITLLHHTHPSLPHYESSEWDWLRGGLATIDRDYGILNTVFHHITDTHVTHHLFSSLPHYHAEEATKAIKPILGNYYQFDGTPWYKALWREYKECVYVTNDEVGKTNGVFWYTNKL